MIYKKIEKVWKRERKLMIKDCFQHPKWLIIRYKFLEKRDKIYDTIKTVYDSIKGVFWSKSNSNWW